jgi:hypothetical protein
VPTVTARIVGVLLIAGPRFVGEALVFGFGEQVGPHGGQDARLATNATFDEGG